MLQILVCFYVNLIFFAYYDLFETFLVSNAVSSSLLRSGLSLGLSDDLLTSGGLDLVLDIVGHLHTLNE